MIHDLVVVELFDVEYYKLIGIPWRYLMMIKLEWLGYRTVKNYDDMLSRFHLIPERNRRTDRRTDRQTDRRTDRFAISISLVGMMTRDKNGTSSVC